MPEPLFNKKRLWHRCFPVNFAKFLRHLFLQNTSGECFLKIFPLIEDLTEKGLSSLKLLKKTKFNHVLSWKTCGKWCSFLCLYRSPSQTRDIFETFADNFELTLETIINKNPFLIVASGDFNAKTTNWYKNDTNSYEGLRIDTITSQFDLQQLIIETTHLIANSSSFIDLIFISQPNLVIQSGVHSSLHPHCHHQIVFAKINLKIVIQHFMNVKFGTMKRRILTLFVDQFYQFPWDNRFSNIDVNQKVNLFNQAIKNILCNFIPHQTFTYDDRDPPWINSKIKSLIQEENIAKKCYFQNNKDIQLFRWFQCIQNLVTATTEKSTEQFYSRISTKLMDPTISPEAYWSILKTFLNDKKVSCIPPIYHNNNYILLILKRRPRSSTISLLNNAR